MGYLLMTPTRAITPMIPGLAGNPVFTPTLFTMALKWLQALPPLLCPTNMRCYTMADAIREGTQGSVTGYYYRKWTPKGCNSWDNKWGNFQAYTPIVRLADVYLMYSEAVLQGYGSPSSKVSGSITAEDAINVVRNRAQLPNISSTYTATKEKFMAEIIRERAVELAFEGHRWFDLRRWNIAGEQKYKEKTMISFDRGANGKPINLKESVVVTRVYEARHKWLPLPINDTKLYEAFPQNPGW